MDMDKHRIQEEAARASGLFANLKGCTTAERNALFTFLSQDLFAQLLMVPVAARPPMNDRARLLAQESLDKIAAMRATGSPAMQAVMDEFAAKFRKAAGLEVA